VEDVIRIAVAAAIGLAVLAAGWWAIRFLVTPGPGEPEAGEVVEVHHEYRCTVCAMRLTVTHAAGDDVAPPRHCREPMEPA
jgi:hypothetical protein